MPVSNISFKKRLALKLFQRFKQNEAKLHPLSYIFWECTLRCNLNCIHCGSDCMKDASIKDMPADDFLKALDQVSNIIDPHKTTIVLTGGEPLLRKDLEQTGKELYEREFPWGIVTNGMLLDKQRIESLVRSGLRTITVSLDGLKDSHNWLRGNTKSFEKALGAIQLISREPDLIYDVVTCVNQRNYSELEEFRDLLIQSGVANWRIFTVFPIGRAAIHSELQLEPKQFKGLFEFIKQTRAMNQIKVNYGCEGFLGNYEQEVRDNFFYCQAGIRIASVLADGSISACPSLRNNFIQGNIYRDNFADVWQNRFELYRNRSWTKTGICSGCSFYKYCQGNGLHLRDEKTNELLFCHLLRIEEGELNH
jgi:radical SAM enzyme (rSAM/lipoprotein system)